MIYTKKIHMFSPGLGEGFKCSSMALSNNFFLSLTDIFINGGVGDEVGDGCICNIYISKYQFMYFLHKTIIIDNFFFLNHTLHLSYMP